MPTPIDLASTRTFWGPDGMMYALRNGVPTRVTFNAPMDTGISEYYWKDETDATGTPYGEAQYTPDPDSFIDKAIPVAALGMAGGFMGYGALSALGGGAAAGGVSPEAGGLISEGLAEGGSLSGVGDAAIAGGGGTDALAGGGMDLFDLGGGLGVDEFGNVVGGSVWDTPGYGLDTSGFGGDFSAEAFGGPQYDMTGWGGDFDVGGGFPLPPNANPNWWDLISKYGGPIANGIGSGLKSLIGKAGAAAGGGGLLDTGIAMAPILAGIAYAKNQGPFDTSRFQSLYDQYNPNALANSYDQNTSSGRASLESGLAARGLSGSTFGNDSLTNFNTARDMGRAELISKGALGANSIASSILDAQIKERMLKNDLYGRALYAVGNVFGGKR